MKENKNSALSVLLILTMLISLGVPAFRMYTKKSAEKTEVKTSVLEDSKKVEQVIRKFDAKPVSINTNTTGVVIRATFSAKVNPGARKPPLQNGINANREE